MKLTGYLKKTIFVITRITNKLTSWHLDITALKKIARMEVLGFNRCFMLIYEKIQTV